MPRFNNAPASSRTRTTNLAGGEAFIESPELEFASLVVTSMVQDQFYRSADQSIDRVRLLMSMVDPLFAAKTAVFARNEYGMRSISHVVAGELAPLAKGQKWTRAFYNAVVRRPDDMTEILAYYLQRNSGKRVLTNPMRDGLAQAFDKFDSYSLAKYRGEGKGISLVDVVNLVHPKPVERNAEALKALVAGTLRSTDTWESQISAAGTAGDGSDEDVADAKSEAWGSLVKSRTIGYFALLKNLRNILEQADEETRTAAYEMLQDPLLIKKSLVLPFRFSTAANALASVPDSRRAMEAISKAIDISLENVPKFDGKTLIVVDGSGSMENGRVGKGTTSPAQVAALFGGVLYKSNDADLMIFSDYAEYVNMDATSSTLSLGASIIKSLRPSGTDFHKIFEVASKPYDRVIILSDMQGWIGQDAPTREFEQFVTRVGKRPHVYSFDLTGMGTLQFPQPQVYCLAGFSDKVFDVMALLEQDKNALVNKIKAVEF